MGSRRRALVAVLLVGTAVASLSACAPDPFTRDDVLEVPHAVLELDEHNSGRWQYLDADLAVHDLGECERHSVWTSRRTCQSVDEANVYFTYTSPRRGHSERTLVVDGEEIPMSCESDFVEGILYCMPTSASPEPTQWPPRRT